MPIVRWDPFRDMVDIRDEIGSWLDSSFERRERKERGTAIWTPSVDIKETDKEVIVKADIPGVKKEDIDVSIDDDQLVIKGERKMEKEEKEKDYLRIERSYGSFYRSFSIGVPVKAEEIKASFKDGELTVSIPKAEAKKPKKIDIDAA